MWFTQYVALNKLDPVYNMRDPTFVSYKFALKLSATILQLIFLMIYIYDYYWSLAIMYISILWWRHDTGMFSVFLDLCDGNHW